MWLEKNNSVLRLALNAPHDIPCVEHEAFLAEVALRTTHSIRIYERFFRWTCVPYALGFAKDPLYGEIASFHHIYATAGFVHCLLDARLQALDRPRPGCLALYFNSGLWTHAGITSTSERLVSKWGGFPVYDHRLEEVPASYGDEVQFFEAPSEGIGLEWFLEYAQASGLSDAEIAEAKRLAQHNLRPMKRSHQGTAIPDPA